MSAQIATSKSVHGLNGNLSQLIDDSNEISAFNYKRGESAHSFTKYKRQSSSAFDDDAQSDMAQYYER